jgi:hypothetical protein
MTAISKEEVKARLAALEQGPWSSGVSKARKQLAPVDSIGSIPRKIRIIALDKFDMSSANKRKSNRLVEILQPHFESEDEVEDPGETRSNLDDALTLPQLYELAVQSGYLPESSIRESARAILKDLLWSAPARRFVSAYDYVAVAMLAGRVGVSGLDPVRPPESNPNGALHFAAFLAHLRAFYTDDQIEVWVSFLDDYIVEEDEPTLLWEYLRGKRKSPPGRAEELLAGCQVFVTSLATHLTSSARMSSAILDWFIPTGFKNSSVTSETTKDILLRILTCGDERTDGQRLSRPLGVLWKQAPTPILKRSFGDNSSKMWSCSGRRLSLLGASRVRHDRLASIPVGKDKVSTRRGFAR